MPRFGRKLRSSSPQASTDAEDAHHPRRRAETAALGLLGVLVVGAPQLLGGAQASSVLAIAVGAVLALAISLAATRGRTLPPLPLLGVVALVALSWTAIQATPWPCGWVTAVAPTSAAKLRAALSLLGEPEPATCTLSHDPGATRAELVKGAAIASAYFAAWLLACRHHGQVVFRLVAGSTVLMATVAVAHALLGLQQVFGFYTPLHTGRGLVLAPLLNMNNLGGFVALGVPIWLAIAHRERRFELRLVAYAASALSILTVLLTLSRGAIAVLLASTSLTAFLLWSRSTRGRAAARGGARGRALGVAASLAASIGVCAYALQDRLLGLTDEDLSKVSLLREGFELARQHPFLGVGRGAFSSVFAGHYGSTVRFVHAENLLAQWSSEWGWPVALTLALAASWALIQAVRASESLLRASAAIGLSGLAVQNLADLSLELVGVSVVAASVLGALTAARSGRAGAPRWLQRLRARPFAWVTVAAAALALVLFGPTLVDDEVLALESRLRHALSTQDRAAFDTTLHRAVRSHPSEPVFAVLASAERVARNDPAAGRWLNRAMSLAPGWQAPHVLAFEWLWRNDRPQQAILELRLAARIDPQAVGAQICTVTRAGVDSLLAAASIGAKRAHVLELGAGCLPPDHATTEAIDELLIRERHPSPLAHQRRAFRLARAGRVDEALAELDLIAKRYPRHQVIWYARSQLLLEVGRTAQAAEVAAQGLEEVAEEHKEALLTVRAYALAQLGKDAELDSALHALRAEVAERPRRLSEVYALEGGLAHTRRRFGQALRAYRIAYDISNDSKHLHAIARVAEAAGDVASVQWANLQLCALYPNEPAYCAERKRLAAPPQTSNEPH